MCIVDFEISLNPRIRHMEKASHRDDLFRRTSISEPREQHDALFYAHGIGILSAYRLYWSLMVSPS